jgi:hypothetical protein
MNILEIELVKKFVKNKGYWWKLFEMWDNQKLIHKRLAAFSGVLIFIIIQFIPISGIPLMAWTMMIGLLGTIGIGCIWGIWWVICEKIK